MVVAAPLHAKVTLDLKELLEMLPLSHLQEQDTYYMSFPFWLNNGISLIKQKKRDNNKNPIATIIKTQKQQKY